MMRSWGNKKYIGLSRYMATEIQLKRFVRKLLTNLTFYSGYCLILKKLNINNGIRILGFHGINEHPSNPYAVSSTDFSTQMGFLVENYKIVSIDQLVTTLQDKKRIPPNTIGITIDDGYQDFYSYGYPVLKRFAIPATVFLPTGFINSNTNNENKQVLPQRKFLSWDQILEMNQNGVEFGSHSVSHRSLAKLTQLDLRYELEYSKYILEMKTGKKITGFAYPYGTFRDVKPSIYQVLKATGYSWAVTSISGINKPGSNIYSLRRTIIELNDGINGFTKALIGALDLWIIMQLLGRYF